MGKLIEYFSGRKSYFIGGFTIAYALIGWGLGYLTQEMAVQLITTGAGLITLRLGIAKK